MIIQTNTYICDLCGSVESETQGNLEPYGDPVITPPEGWSAAESGDICPNDDCRKAAVGPIYP